MKRCGALAMLAVAWASPIRGQTGVVVGDVGPGASGRIIRNALEQPHRLIEPDTGWYVVARGQEIPTTLIVLGRAVAVAGSVRGDVIVVGGDLFIRPGGRVSGSATAVGGGVYASSLGMVSGQMRPFRDNTFSITPIEGGYRLDYVSLSLRPSPPLLLPGIYGLRMPAYDRVNGVSAPFGPALSLASGRAELNAVATYRSDLGKIDPSVDLRATLSRRLLLRARAERATLTNDAWIWSDFVNSLSVFAYGTDTRNYFRADRATASMHRRWEFNTMQVEPFAGALIERSWTVGPAALEQRGPWSLWGRADSLRMWRANPPIEDGRIASALLGTTLEWEAQAVAVNAATRAEVAFDAPSDERFEQATTDLRLSFPTFGEQAYALDVHWVTTLGDTPPPQRFAYLGGPGTLPFIDLLAEGGDQLILVEQRYAVPLPAVQLGLLGSPTLLLRHRLGSAGIGRLPAFDQVVGIGALITLVRVELQVDPARRHARFSAGFSFSR